MCNDKYTVISTPTNVKKKDKEETPSYDSLNKGVITSGIKAVFANTKDIKCS